MMISVKELPQQHRDSTAPHRVLPFVWKVNMGEMAWSYVDQKWIVWVDLNDGSTATALASGGRTTIDHPNLATALAELGYEAVQ